MAPYRPCRHCTAKGCAIYPDRPEDPCKLFQCAWLQEGSKLPEDMRPDLSGVIVVMDRKWHDWPVIFAVATGEAIPEPSLDWLKRHAEATRTPLILYECVLENGQFKGRHRHRGYGPPAFVEAVHTLVGPQDVINL